MNIILHRKYLKPDARSNSIRRAKELERLEKEYERLMK